MSLTISGSLPPLTAEQILARLVTVDGAGSGLDADTVDGWSPGAAPVAPFGAPSGMVRASPATPRIRLYPDSLFRS